MIHQLPTLTRPLIVFDTETTGTDTQKDRIIEIGFQQWTADGLAKEWRSLVNPGVPIPASATRVHGITDGQMRACAKCGLDIVEHQHVEMQGHDFKQVPTFKHLAANLAKGFTNCDYAGKNVRFDLRILAAEFARAGVEWSTVGARIIDIDRLEALLNPRSLSHLYRKYTGEELDGAHGALADVRGSTTVIQHQLEAFVLFTSEGLPRDLDALHALQFPGMIDLEGKFKFVDSEPCFTGWGKYANKPMRAAEVSYWDWILKNDFSVDVKRLAGEAKLGRFPQEK